MNSYTNPYTVSMVSDSPEAARAEFIRKTYGHLAGAIGLFVVLEGLFLRLGLGEAARQLLGASRYSWLMVLCAFMLVSRIADRWATQCASPGMQYAGLILYTVAEAVIFLPMIALAMVMTGDLSLLLQAGLITAAMVLGSSAVAIDDEKGFQLSRWNVQDRRIRRTRPDRRLDLPPVPARPLVFRCDDRLCFWHDLV